MTATDTEVHAARQPDLVLCELGRPPLPRHESLSPYCLKVHRALKAAGLRYRSRHGFTPATHREHNPTGQVPVLLIDGVAVADSTAILRRLAALPDTPPWAALPPATLAEAMLWEELADTSINGFVAASRWADPRNWPGMREALFARAPALVRVAIAPLARRRILAALVARDVWRAGPDACWDRFVRLLDDLERRAPVAGFWLGEALSPADLGLFAHLHSLRIPWTAWQAARVEERPRLRAWLDRVDAATWPEDQPA